MWPTIETAAQGGDAQSNDETFKTKVQQNWHRVQQSLENFLQ
jgi:hypothetical protein